MLPPRKWLWSLGLLAAAPVAATAGPLDVFKPKAEAPQTAPAEFNQKVAQDIASALKQARLVGRDIDIEFLNGTAKLSGQIADESQRAAATRVVSSVPGVRSVENRLNLMQDSPRSFAAAPVQQAGYEGNVRQPIQRVDFESVQPEGASVQGQAIPAGAIPAGAFPAGAFPAGAIPQDAYPVGALPPGAIPYGAFPAEGMPIEAMQGYPVEGMQGYPVEFGGQPGFGGQPVYGDQSFSSGGISANQAIAQQVAEAVTGSGLRDYDLEIKYKDGVCTLIGAVDNQGQAISACEAAAKVSGVQKVVNRLMVNGRPVSVAQRQQQSQTAQFSPYPNAYAAQMAMAGQQGPAGAPLAAAPQPQQGPRTPVYPASAQQLAMGPQGYGASPMGYGPAAYGPQGPAMGAPGSPTGMGPHMTYNRPNLPEHAWPAQAPYDNFAAVSYPSQYDASAWPYIGPFYPYPQVPLGWRSAQLVWDDGYWNLKFDSKTDRWWWFLNPENWH